MSQLSSSCFSLIFSKSKGCATGDDNDDNADGDGDNDGNGGDDGDVDGGGRR